MTHYALSQRAWLLMVLVFSLLFVSALFTPKPAHAASLTIVAATTTSNNASSTLAKIGNTVTFGLQLSGTPFATSTPVINFFGMGTTSLTGSGTYWQYSTTSSSVWTEGFLSFNFAWGGSASGDASSTATASSLTGPNVRFDKTAPTITSITSSISCTGSGGACKPGDTITFTLTPGATEYGATVSGSYNGKSLTWSTGNSGATYTATYTVSGSDPSQGSPLQISGVVITDAAGNASAGGAGSDITSTISASGGSSSSSSSHTYYYSGGGSSALTVISHTATSTTLLIATTTAAQNPIAPTQNLKTTAPSVAVAASSAVAIFTRSLHLGTQGTDVKALQVFLNTHGFPIAPSGMGSSGMETSYFGMSTRAALIKFQKANGITPASGLFGPKTCQVISGM